MNMSAERHGMQVSRSSSPSTQPSALIPQHSLSGRYAPTRFGRMYARVGEPEEGSHPAVILVHGLVISSRYMVPTAERLAPWCRVFAVDLPGYGKSEKPHRILSLSELADALADWMDQEKVPSAHLVRIRSGVRS